MRRQGSQKGAVSWRRFLFTIGLSAGALLFARQVWLSYRGIRQQEFVLHGPIYLLGGLALSFLVYVLQALAWTMVMRYLGVFLSLRQTFQGYFLSFLPRYIPGSVWGYWTRSQWLEESCNVDYATSVLGSIMEAMALILTALNIGGVYFCSQSTGSVRLALALGSAGLLGLTWLVIPRLAILISQRLGKGKSPSHYRQNSSSRAWSAAIALYLILWVTYGGSILFIGNAILRAPSSDLLATTFASSLSWTLGFIAIVVPTGIGVRELTLSTLLSLHSGFPPWQADLVAVISRLEIILAELGWLMVGLGLYAYKWQKDSRLPSLFPSCREK